jgi:hypothetical protein
MHEVQISKIRTDRTYGVNLRKTEHSASDAWARCSTVLVLAGAGRPRRVLKHAESNKCSLLHISARLVGNRLVVS